ncbi:MAG: hypothetical protein WCV86_04715 [Patescibacteria group bacterium]|jgi:hypothetical protein
MTIFWLTTLGVFTFVVLEGIVSWIEGTLTKNSRRKPGISFLAHSAMWSDAFLLSVILGLILPHLVYPWWGVVIGLLLGSVASVALHRAWGSSGATGHMWHSHASRHWLRDMSIAGWMHFLFTIFALAIMYLYVASPVPSHAAWLIGAILVVFVPAASLVPTMVLTRGKPGKNEWKIAGLMWGMVLLVTALKVAGF